MLPEFAIIGVASACCNPYTRCAQSVGLAIFVLDCAEEMADVMEVLYAMGKTCAVSKREIEQVRSQKAAEKGTFSKKIFLVSTEK